MADAAGAYDDARYRDALRAMRPVIDAAPQVAAVRELAGLIRYRLGQWRAAMIDLATYRNLTGATDQLPALADCMRALGRHDRVEEMWEDMKPIGDASTIAEGRLVMVGSLADRGRLADAIALLAPKAYNRAHPRPHHLRTWYALADLYERSGDLPRARALFRRVAQHDSGFFDVNERLESLG